MSESERECGLHEANSARIAVAIIFSVFGLLIGTWAPHIPLAKEKLAATPFWFGMALLCMGLGSIFTMPMVGTAVSRFGSSRVICVSAVSATLAMLLPFLASSLPTFALGLLIFGSALGALDVAMNAQGFLVEKLIRKTTMSTFHGIYSVAGLLGGLLSATLIQRVDEVSRGGISIALCMILLFFALPRLLPASADQGSTATPLGLPSRYTIGLGLLCLVAFLTESSVIDWTGIYLREEFSSSGQLVAVNFAAYSCAMACSRLFGDRLRNSFGSASLVRWAALTCGISLGLGMISPIPALSILFFALSGLAVGPIAPILTIAGGKAEKTHPGRGIAAVATLGYLGSTLGPPLVGLIASASDLFLALISVAVMSLLASWFAGTCIKED